jgi:hypothetical protein
MSSHSLRRESPRREIEPQWLLSKARMAMCLPVAGMELLFFATTGAPATLLGALCWLWVALEPKKRGLA